MVHFHWKTLYDDKEINEKTIDIGYLDNDSDINYDDQENDEIENDELSENVATFCVIPRVTVTKSLMTNFIQSLDIKWSKIEFNGQYEKK